MSAKYKAQSERNLFHLAIDISNDFQFAHVDEPVNLFQAQVIAKSIGQAFNVAYQEFLRHNGLTDEVVEDAEYNGVLEAQKILGEDLSLLADESNAKEVSYIHFVFFCMNRAFILFISAYFLIAPRGREDERLWERDCTM